MSFWSTFFSSRKNKKQAKIAQQANKEAMRNEEAGYAPEPFFEEQETSSFSSPPLPYEETETAMGGRRDNEKSYGLPRLLSHESLEALERERKEQRANIEARLESLSLIGKRTKLRIGILVVSLAMLAFSALLIAQLFRLQVVQGDYYSRLAAANHFKRRILYPERGKIEDVNGEILAMTVYTYTIGVSPSVVKSNVADFNQRASLQEIISQFSDILELPLETVQTALNAKDKPYVQLAKNIEKDKYEKLRAYIESKDISGIAIDISDKRYYPNRDLASAVLGYTSKQSQRMEGVIGLEKQYDQELAGEPGFSFGEVDHYTGRPLPYSSVTEKEMIDGKNIVLNLNLDLQKQVQDWVIKYAQVYDAQDGAAAIVMNAKTGAIVAMAQSNSVDLNEPLGLPTQLISVEDERVEADRNYRRKEFDKLQQRYEKEFEEHIQALEDKLDEKHRNADGSEVSVEEAGGLESTYVLSAEKREELRLQIEEERKAFREEREKERESFEKSMALTALPNPSDWAPNTHQNDMYFLNNKVWQNILVSTPYEPGSTFKTFTVAAGLEEHVFSQKEAFADAPIQVPGWDQYPISCWFNPNNHGWETVEQGLARSCNPVMVQVAERLGAEKFMKYVRGLGFFDRTEIDLPFENIGILHDKLSLIDLATFSFGEQNTVTPIQVVTAYTAIANHGLMVRPHMVKYITDKSGRIYKDFGVEPIRQVFSRETTERVLAMLRYAVTDGIVNIANTPGYFVGGKTGTSTKLTNDTRPTNEEDYYEDNYSVNSSVTLFPIHDPQFIVFTMFNNPRTTVSFVPQALAREIIRETGRVYNVQKIYAPKDLERLLQVKTLQTQTGVSLNTLVDYLVRNDFMFDLEEGLSPLEPFYTSYPPTGTQFNGLPILYISRDGSPPSEKIEVPDFIGQTAVQAIEYARRKRVNLFFTGDPEKGRVDSQSIEVLTEEGKANTMTPYSVITLNFTAEEGEDAREDLIFRDNPIPDPDIDLPVRYLFKRQTYSDWSAVGPNPDEKDDADASTEEP